MRFIKPPDDGLLQKDVAALIRDAYPTAPRPGQSELAIAHDVIVVVRERVLRELESYARQHVR